MALNDLIESTYITKWKKEKANQALRQRIFLKDIVLTEEFQKINDAATASANACIGGYFKLSPQEKDTFERKHQFNLIVTKLEDGRYALLTGLISYLTLEGISQRRRFSHAKKKESGKIDTDFKEKKVKAFVVDFPYRVDFLNYCKETYDISFNADIDYIKTDSSNTMNIDSKKENELFEKISNDASFFCPITAIPIDGRLYPTENIEVYFAAKRANKSKIRVQILKNTGLPAYDTKEDGFESNIEILF